MGFNTRMSWAVITGEPDSRLAIIGQGWIDADRLGQPGVFPWALFRTRRQARELLAKVKGPVKWGRFPRARVARVFVTITEAPG